MGYYNFHEEFKDNAMQRKLYFVVHWTGSKSAISTVNYLENRLNGKGTVGYNVIIDINGDIYSLAGFDHFFHNTGLGTDFDALTYSIAFTGNNAKNILENKKMIASAKIILDTFYRAYPNCEIEVCCHRELNENKPDFPEKEWEILKEKLMD